jgi:carnosine N-methyltransferase
MMNRSIFFGHFQNDLQNISSAVAFAFDQYRHNLLTTMKSFDEMIERIDEIDKQTNFQFSFTHSKIKAVAANYPLYWEANEMIFNNIVKPSELQLTYAILPSLSSDIHGISYWDLYAKINETSSKNSYDVSAYNSLTQLIIHLTRDWTPDGSNVRKDLYFDHIIPKMINVLPLSSGSNRLLIPGAGTGRLAMELLSLGYQVEINECSATMMSFLNSLCHTMLPYSIQYTFYPYLHYQFTDDWDLEKREATSQFPFYEDSPTLQQYFSSKNNSSLFSSLSVQYGDFVKVYGMNATYRMNSFDGIITNFFIDTGRNIFDYLTTIKQLLIHDGIWLNIGPLHYHNKNAIPYSLKHLLEIIEGFGFHTISYETISTSYCGEENITMKPEYYHIPIHVFRLNKNSKSKDDGPDSSSSMSNSLFERPKYKIIN